MAEDGSISAETESPVNEANLVFSLIDGICSLFKVQELASRGGRYLCYCAADCLITTAHHHHYHQQ